METHKKKFEKKFCRIRERNMEEENEETETESESETEEENEANEPGEKKGKEEIIKLNCINLRSSRKHFQQLITEMEEELERTKVLTIIEANISEEEKPLFQIKGFEQIGKVRQNQKGGGIMMYIRNGMHWEIINTRERKAFEQLAIRITTEKEEKVTLLTIYKPKHHPRFIEEFQDLINEMQDKKVVIMGDVNIDLKKTKSRYINDYKNFLAENNLIIRTKGTTRESTNRNGQVTKTHIDHVYTRETSGKGYIIKFYISDHYMVGIDLEEKSKKQKDQIKLEYDSAKIKKLIQEERWETAEEVEEVDQYYDEICKKFERIYGKARKKKTKTKEQNKTEKLPARIKTLIDLKNTKHLQLRKESKKQGKKHNEGEENKKLEELKKECKQMQNKVKTEIRKYKNSTTIKKINEVKGNIRKTWEEVNVIIGKAKNKNIDENILKYMKGTHKEIAEEFQKTFQKQVENISNDCKVHIKIRQDKPKMKVTLPLKKFELITEEDITKIIQNMKNKSPGTDKIRMKDLKGKEVKITKVIKNIINRSLSQRKIPRNLKTTIVRPLYKKGAHNNYNNYRQIAIQNTIGKILEKHVQKQIKEHLSTNNTIDSNQWGFQEKKGTPNLLKDIVEYIYTKLKEGKHIVMVAIDYEKCFDTLDHNIIIEKLKEAGIEEEALQWLTDYFRERETVVKIGDEMSNPTKIKKGTPQGSLLSPLIYLMYGNDIGNYLEEDYRLFADDTILIVAHKDPEIARRKAEADFRRLQIWAHNNRIIINKEKTQFLHIKPKRHDEEPGQYITFHDHNCLHNPNKKCECQGKIEKVDKIKYLGITLDKNFNFKPHIDGLEKRLRSVLYQMYKLKQVANEKILKTVYFALAESIIQYGLEAWGRANEGFKAGIQRLQDKIIEAIIPYAKNKKMKTRKEKYNYLHILPINELFQYKTIISNYYNEKYKKNEKGHDYKLRRSQQYRVNIPTNSYESKTDEFLIPTIFNKLPENLLNISKIGKAKKEIKQHLLTKM